MSATDAGLNTIIAGVRCREVLDELSDVLDGTMSLERRAKVEAHLARCDRCARMGGDVARVVSDLRAALGAPAPLAPDRAAQLLASLHRAQRV